MTPRGSRSIHRHFPFSNPFHAFIISIYQKEDFLP